MIEKSDESELDDPTSLPNEKKLRKEKEVTHQRTRIKLTNYDHVTGV